MSPAVRWLVVAMLAVGVVVPSVLPHVLPAAASDASAASLAQSVQRGMSVPWTGEVSALGAVHLPSGTSAFGGVSRLLGERTDLRVWWRDSRHFRLDRLRTTGESDLLRTGDLLTRWSSEQETAKDSLYSPLRLPDDNDLVPAALAERLFAGARPSEVSRLPSVRVAGRSAPGVRLRPAATASTIAAVDVWCDASSGLPLRVEVYADGSAQPVLTSEVTTFHVRRPTAQELTLALGAHRESFPQPGLDSIARANAFAPFLLPGVLAGLARQSSGGAAEGAVGVYGRGPTALLVLPVRDSVANALEDQLARQPGARLTGLDVSLQTGPLSVLLIRGEQGDFLLTGTVTPGTLQTAAAGLRRDAVRTR